jgi:hypothetical protein
MRYALVQDSKVINVIIADESWQHPEFSKISDPNGMAEPGGTWDGTQFLPPPIPEPPPPSPITQVTMRQARLVLLNNDLLDSVEQVIAQASKAVQIEWEYATVVYRDSELVTQIASQLGLSVEQIDALFQEAHTL